MTIDKDRKRIIRTRMQKTGESYTAARAQILSKPTVKPPAPDGSTQALRDASLSIDYASRAGMSDDKIAEKTGRTWQQWVRLLDKHQAMSMPHREISSILHEQYRVPDWWTQAVAVGYERIKGLREKGQRRGGAYEATKSKTVNASVRALFDAWADARLRRKWLGGVKATVRTATAPKSMRLQWPDGAIVAVWFLSKSATKSTVALAHTKLPTKAAAEEVKKFWAARLDALADLLAAAD